MNANDAALGQPLPPQRDRKPAAAALFGLIGGPLAWFLQLDAGYALASWPCFPKDQRVTLPLAGFAWTRPAIILLLVAAVIVGLAALLVSLRGLRPAADTAGGSGLDRFLALWGALLGGGFAIATVLTAVALLVLPRCAG